MVGSMSGFTLKFLVCVTLSCDTGNIRLPCAEVNMASGLDLPDSSPVFGWEQGLVISFGIVLCGSFPEEF